MLLMTEKWKLQLYRNAMNINEYITKNQTTVLRLFSNILWVSYSFHCIHKSFTRWICAWISAQLWVDLYG